MDVTGDVRNPAGQVVRRQLISIHREEAMKTRLENHIAIVTGSSSGNGRAIALTLSSAGATVVCADLNKKARKEGYEEDIEIDTDDVILHRGGQSCLRSGRRSIRLRGRESSDTYRLGVWAHHASK